MTDLKGFVDRLSDAVDVLLELIDALDGDAEAEDDAPLEDDDPAEESDPLEDDSEDAEHDGREPDCDTEPNGEFYGSGCRDEA